MASVKLPSFQFYPGDWMKDPALRAVTIAARGLWIDMLCLMHESPRRGYLQHETGKAVSAEQLARMTGCLTDGASSMLQELEDAGVFSRTTEGVIYSRRIVRDERKRGLCSEAGTKGGGNPTFKGVHKGGSKGEDKRGTKASSSSSSSSSPSGEEPPLPPKGGGDVDPPGFAEFWDSWPKHFRKVQRAKCVAHWTANGLSTMPGEIAHCLGAWKVSEQWAKDRGQFIPAPLVWLRGRPWEAAAPPAAESGGEVPPRNETPYQRAKRQLSERENAA